MEIAERRAAISGIGQSEIGRRLGRDPLELTLDACLAAIADAGLTPREIDGVRRAKVIGKHVKPVVGGRVLLTQKVRSLSIFRARYCTCRCTTRPPRLLWCPRGFWWAGGIKFRVIARKTRLTALLPAGGRLPSAEWFALPRLSHSR